ncbi:MAG: DNA topoisomerase IV subunit A [Rhodothermales bacterium]|nr:DNA topoisomerase IV subunit A [Rhodothermales bacterium]MBO6781584.1 DNA topoisomerase IV subunit A [Rhodothermales bacterium]
MPIVDVVPLHETTSQRYLNYALSVITSRALPDIRDGLKPVHRRILYAMYNNLRLYPDGRFRKSATVVGEVMGKYHPHGDSAIYEAMVRMAQDFSLRVPLVHGHGNFGSLDGDSPAAMRYTEAKLQAVAMELLQEIRKNTVAFRPTFDGTLNEPVVLPARWPNLLVNGSSGIAVGMATNIPPHNLGEVVDALIYMVGNPNPRVSTLVEKFVRAPDFPTGGRILNTPDELLAIYENGEGPVEVRGEYESEGKSRVIVTSIPYGISKSSLIEQIADQIIKGKLPQVVDVRDESTDDVRIVLELKRGAAAEVAMAYLLKHTSLQTRFHVNMTCLLPTDNPEVCRPEKVDLKTVLRHFLDFRMEVVVRRLRYDLHELEKRIHILRGFEIIFNDLDEAIRLIRASDGKRDAAEKLMARFELDEVQTEAILETKLYKLARLEIEAIRAELAEKEAAAAALRELLGDEVARWKLIKDELREVRKQFGDDRRTLVAGPDEALEYSVEDYIVDEEVYVIVTGDGWVKRQGSYKDVESIRVRDGDSVSWVLPGSTRKAAVFFTNVGTAYTTRIEALPSTTGHGLPIQKLFDFSDGERIVGVVSMDEAALPKPVVEPDSEPELFGDREPANEGPYFVAMSRNGQCLRLPLSTFSEPSTRVGRRFMRLLGNDEVLGVEPASGSENVCLATKEGFALIYPVQQVPVMKGAAKGVIAVRLGARDSVLGFTLSQAARQGLEVETTRGRREVVRTTKFEVSNRGNKGRLVIQRGSLVKVVRTPVEIRRNGTA